MNNKKVKYKVCHLLFENFPADPRVRRYVNTLNDNNISCIIICSKKKNDKFYENWNDNLVYRIPVTKLRQSFILTFFEYAAFMFISFFLISYLGIKYRFKIVHVHSLPDYLIFAATVNKLFRVKLILDLHEIFPELFIARKPHLQNSIWVKILKLLEKISIKFSDILITIHDPAKELLVERNKGLDNKIYVIMNGVDPKEFLDREKIITSDFVIMYNGTVVKLLNLQMIIQALKVLAGLIPEKDYDRIKFKIFGGGPAVQELLQFAEELNIKEKVTYEGFVPPQIMNIEVLKASVCILPPIKNIYSDLFYTTKLTEMVFLKIPVIATRLKTYKRYYGEDSLFYFDSGNLNQLAERIMDVFYNKELVKSKVENAYADYLKVRWEIMGERYFNLINKFL